MGICEVTTGQFKNTPRYSHSKGLGRAVMKPASEPQPSAALVFRECLEEQPLSLNLTVGKSDRPSD